MLKRFCEIIASAFLLLLFLPFLLLIACITAFNSKGKIIYSQERIGLHRKPFMMYKFISMHSDAEKNGPALWVLNDERQTKWGEFMRKHRIDELPQLWNILIGDMSFVGATRPERMFYIEQIVQQNPNYWLLLQQKPGLISLGIIHFGYASSVNQMLQRMEYDLTYLKSASLFSDCMIILKAINKVLFAKV
ncbi:MAG: sugar transferase [Chitinophagaceae bacterium]